MPSLNISVAQIRVQQENLFDQQFQLHVFDSNSQITQETVSFGQQYWLATEICREGVIQLAIRPFGTIYNAQIQQGFRQFSEYWSGLTWAISLQGISYWETDETGPSWSASQYSRCCTKSPWQFLSLFSYILLRLDWLINESSLQQIILWNREICFQNLQFETTQFVFDSRIFFIGNIQLFVWRHWRWLLKMSKTLISSIRIIWLQKPVFLMRK